MKKILDIQSCKEKRIHSFISNLFFLSIIIATTGITAYGQQKKGAGNQSKNNYNIASNRYSPEIAQRDVTTSQQTNNFIDSSAIIDERKETQIEDKLVLLALNSPTFDESSHESKIGRYELSKARNSWLDLLTISTNYNDQTFAKPSPSSEQATYVYPKYFFGINIPLGLVLSRSSNINIAKENMKINSDRQEVIARTIKADVLSKYKQYKMYGQLLTVQSQTVDDEHAALMQTENQFKNGTISIEMYNTASKNYNVEVTKKLELQLQRDLMKLEIEKMIGTDLEEVLKGLQ